MTLDGIILVVAIVGFIIFFVFFSVLNRKWPTYPIYTIFSSFVLAFLVSIILSWMLIPTFSFSLIAIFLYILLVGVYIFAIYINIDSSLHVRVLQEIAKIGSKGLTFKDLLSIYNKEIILKKRIAWLVNCGEIGLEGNKFYMRRRYSLLLIREKFLVLLSKLYGGKEFSILLFLILLGALLVRLSGINFGLPNMHFIDEGHLIYWAFYSGSHALQPPYYLYAPLIPMILLVEFSIFYIGGYFFGIFSNPSQFFISYLSDPTIFFLIGRITMAIAGVATVWLLFNVGRKFFNERIGMLACFFLAFTFLHVKESHYIKQDILLGFFVLAVFYFALKLLQKGSINPAPFFRGVLTHAKKNMTLTHAASRGVFKRCWIKDYLLGGVMFGLAMGTKYQAILMLPVILLAHVLNKTYANNYRSSLSRTARTSRFSASWRITRRIRDFIIDLRGLLLLGGISFLTFCLIHPYFILEPSVTLLKTLANASGTLVIYPEHLQGKPVWWWFMFEHIPDGIGYPLFISSIIGFAVSFWRAKSKKSYLFIPFLPILFFVAIDRLTQLHFARYSVMLLPFFMLAAAIFLDSVAEKTMKPKAFLVVLAIILVFPTMFRTIQFDSLLAKPDTRTLAKAWFERTIPVGSKVLVESTIKPEYPSILNVALNLDEKSINKRIKDAVKRGLEASYLKSLVKANKNKIGYTIVATTQVGGKVDIFTDEFTYLKNIDYYIDSGVEYIVLTSWIQEKMKPEFAKSLYKNYQLIKEFRPTYEFVTDPHLIKMDYEALDKVDIFRNNVVFGPVIKVYKIRNPNFEIRNKLE